MNCWKVILGHARASGATHRQIAYTAPTSSWIVASVMTYVVPPASLEESLL